MKYDCLAAQSLFQLRFALVVPCARWYDYQVRLYMYIFLRINVHQCLFIEHFQLEVVDY